MGKTIKKNFTEKELNEVCQMYKDGYSIRYVARHFHCCDKRINSILLENGININDPKCPYIKNKPCGYWNDRAHCEEAAKQCVNRKEFSRKFISAYKASQRNGWLLDFDQYFSKEPHFANFNDKIHVVYSYEVESEHAVYVGRTTNLKRRHASHKRGSFTTKHKTYKDTIFDFCKSVGVPVPDVKILEEHLTAVESQRQEEFWENRYQEEGWNVLNRAVTGEGRSSLGATMRKWNYETCKDAASQCISKIDFKSRFSTAYRVSVQNGWIDEFFQSNLLKETGYFDDLDNCIKESRNYKGLTDIKRNYPFLYHKICEHKWNEDVRMANGWRKFGVDKRDKIAETVRVNKNTSTLDFIPIEIEKLSEYEKKVYYHLRHFDCKLLKDSVYNSRLNLLVNNKAIIGVDTLKNNLEYTAGVSHMTFLNETIEYGKMGYPMIHILDSDLVDNEEVTLDKIDLTIGNTESWTKIGARECEVKEIYKSVAEDFLNENHIQGFNSASMYIGAIHNEEVVAVMCFKNGGLNNNEWELTRFATKNRHFIQGIGSRMFKHFIDTYDNVDQVISFCERRFLLDVDNNFYTKTGFILDKINRPDYKYVDTNAIIPRVYHKMYFNKQKLHKKYGFPLTMTETEMAKELGYDRIWDCGLIKYVWKKEN